MRLVRVADRHGSGRRCADLHDLHAGRIVVHASETRQTGEDFCELMLRGLGKRPGAVTGIRRNANAKRELVEAWIAGEQVHTVIVTGAARLGRLVCSLVDLALITDVALYLVASGNVSRGARPRLADVGIDDMDIETFLAGPWPMSEPREHVSAFPRAPHANVGFGRLAARTHLEQHEFERYDETWGRGHEHAAHALAEYGRGATEQIADALRLLIADTRDTNEALACLAGAQAALLVGRSHLLRIKDRNRFMRFARPPAEAVLTEAHTTLLRQYVHTRYAALAALRLATYAAPDALSALTVADVAADGRRVTVADHEVEIAAEAQGIILAHRALRLFHGATASDPLFLVDNDAYPIKPVGVQRVLLRIAAETGLPVAQHHSFHASATGTAWMKRAGLELQEL
jgi:hypothetical protein